MRFLINRSDAIGDLVLTLPIVRKIKSHFPDCHITLIVSEKCVGLIKLIDGIDDYWINPKSQSSVSKLFYYREIREVAE